MAKMPVEEIQFPLYHPPLVCRDTAADMVEHEDVFPAAPELNTRVRNYMRGLLPQPVKALLRAGLAVVR
jgi:hypothetical protein